jgi:hypothetical protein
METRINAIGYMVLSAALQIRTRPIHCSIIEQTLLGGAVSCMAIRGYTIEAYFWVLLLIQCERKPSYSCTTLLGTGVGTIVSS